MAPKKKPAFIFLLCVSCGICAQICPVSCIELSVFSKKGDWNLYPTLNAPCLGCGSCAKACPVEAVTMEEST